MGSGLRRVGSFRHGAGPAFGYTKLTGELTHDSIETAAGTETADQWFIQGMQTLSARWFAAGRLEGANTPALPLGTPPFLRTLRVSEATVGYRLSRDFTMRGSFVSSKLYFWTGTRSPGGHLPRLDTPLVVGNRLAPLNADG